ncbi:hypothetical protein NL676_014082 [Syzygium grande]|nr:hypothetical protein NL676_014082 [Syzygium grande]
MVTGGASTASHGGAWHGRNAWLNDCCGGDSKDSRLETLRGDTRFGSGRRIGVGRSLMFEPEVAGCSSVRLGTAASSSDGEQKRRQGRCQAGKGRSEQFAVVERVAVCWQGWCQGKSLG